MWNKRLSERNNSINANPFSILLEAWEEHFIISKCVAEPPHVVGGTVCVRTRNTRFYKELKALLKIIKDNDFAAMMVRVILNQIL